MLKGEEIYALIPQRPPVVMVDVVDEVTAEGTVTALTIGEDNVFVSEGVLREAGLIEHIAQSAAAFAGYQTKQQNRPPRLGYIGEIKNAVFSSFPLIGSTLHTQLHLVAEVAGVSLIEAETQSEGRHVASCQMKIFLKEN